MTLLKDTHNNENDHIIRTVLFSAAFVVHYADSDY